MMGADTGLLSTLDISSPGVGAIALGLARVSPLLKVLSPF
jgi:hypothetical protein